MATSLIYLEGAAAAVHEVMRPTPQHPWPLLAERTGTEVWIKHENHTPSAPSRCAGA